MDDFVTMQRANGFPDGAPKLGLPVLDDAAVTALVRDIEDSGYAVLPDYIGPDMLTHLRGLVLRLIEASGGEYTVLSGAEEMANTLLAEIGRAPNFVRLMHGLFEKTSRRPAPRQSVYQVLRCLVGETGRTQAYFFHYDSYVVTALLPIITPTEGNTGDLLIKPNNRGVRSWYLANIFDKLLVDNRLAQILFRRDAIAQRRGFGKVKIVPGNLYLFWGYRSVHANAPCDIEKIRATALFHFGDPHSNSALRKYTGKAAVRATTDTAPN